MLGLIMLELNYFLFIIAKPIMIRRIYQTISNNAIAYSLIV